MSRLDLIRPAARPKMNARALFQGPQGSGKTWTMLSVARIMSPPPARIVLIDTERESALTYADVFQFEHLPWRPPYDAQELTHTLDGIGRQLTANDVVIVDSLSHFWQGSGGILDVANGRVQGGWDKARPIQNALVEQLLAMPCHVLLGARMKNTVLVSDGGKTIENVGLTIVQDDTLGYELNIVVQMDMNHNATVMKSRTPAVPVGRLYPGGHEQKLADDYGRWLAGGIPPANRLDVEAIVAIFGGIADREARKTLKDGFVAAFGMPHSLTAEQVPAARAWLAENGAAIGSGPPAAAQTPNDAPEAPPAADAPAAAPGAENEPERTDPEPAAGGAVRNPGAPVSDLMGKLDESLAHARDVAAEVAEAKPAPTQDEMVAAIAAVKAMTKQAIVTELAALGLPTNGNVDALSARLVQARLAAGWAP